MFSRFSSRRSTVYSKKGMVASTQPLANAAGLKVLEKGGNCVDASVAVLAALCVVEPGSTGVGGDCFVLYYDKNKKKVHGLSGHGKLPQKLSIDVVRERAPEIKGPRLPLTSVHAITVPGAICGWIDAVEKWGSGKVTLEDIFLPAIELAEDGFAVSAISAQMWHDALEKLTKQSGKNADVFLNADGSFCKTGDVFTNKPLAKLFRKVAQEGKKGFYEGDVAAKIVQKVQEKGGVMELDDLKKHASLDVDPLCMDFEGKYLWEIPPSGQGIVALLALGYIKELAKVKHIDLKALKHNSAEYLHFVTEAVKLAFYDSEELVADLEFHPEIDVKKALSEEALAERAKLIKKNSVLRREQIEGEHVKGPVPNPMYKGDTVYFTVTDKDGNACSFINSVFTCFGTGIIPDDYGFALQSRGGNFNLTPGAINSLEGGKRPYHTIIPSLITQLNESQQHELYASVACMGGWAQPQAHVQILLNMVLFGFDAQEALDAPRFCLEPNEQHRHLDVGKGSGGPVSTPHTLVKLEEGIDKEVVEELRQMGHCVEYVTGWNRGTFGRSQCIKNEAKGADIVWSGGSDLRGDGAAVPQI